MFRSVDGRPIDVVNSDGNYQKGLDAVLDCVLLSRTDYLIRTASNLSLCATLFNARVPEHALEPRAMRVALPGTGTNSREAYATGMDALQRAGHAARPG